jgi:hypothetical protein
MTDLVSAFNVPLQLDSHVLHLWLGDRQGLAVVKEQVSLPQSLSVTASTLS